MDHFLAEAKRLVQRLQNHDNAVDILISETTNLQNKLISMRQYRDEVNQMNQAADHRPRSTLILGSQLENQRIQNLEQENRELSISLAEHQSALELIMNKYREQVLVMMKANGTQNVLSAQLSQPTQAEIIMSEKIVEMACVMRQSASIDESVAAKEIETLRSLELENANLRELLEISGKDFPNSMKNELTSMSNTIPTKDSGFCEHESPIVDVEHESPTVDVERLSYKPIRIKSKSKPAATLQNLFSNQVPENYNEYSDEQENDTKDNSYKLYTIEKFIPCKEVDSDTKLDNHQTKEGSNTALLENGDFLDIFRKNLNEDNDLLGSTDSAISSPHNSLTSSKLKDIFSEWETPVNNEHSAEMQKLDKSSNEEYLHQDSAESLNEVNKETETREDYLTILKGVHSNSSDETNKNLEDLLVASISTENNVQENTHEYVKENTQEDALNLLDDAIDEETDFTFHHNDSIDSVLQEVDSIDDNHRTAVANQSTDGGEYSDASSECSETTVIDFALEKTLTDNKDEEEAALLADMDSFLDDQFDMEPEDEQENDE